MKYIILVLTVSITGCAYLMPNSLCQGNWGEAGMRDGRSGMEPAYGERRADQCSRSDNPMNVEQYKAAYDEGIKKYCTASHAYFVGEMGLPLYDRCGSKQAELKKHYEEGRKLYDLKSRKTSLLSTIKETKEDKSVFADIGRGVHMVKGTNRTQAEEDELAKVEADIHRMISVAPDLNEFCESEREANAITGAMVPGFIKSRLPANTLNPGCSRAQPVVR